jgi:hypothetical protein
MGDVRQLVSARGGNDRGIPSSVSPLDRPQPEGQFMPSECNIAGLTKFRIGCANETVFCAYRRRLALK